MWDYEQESFSRSGFSYAANDVSKAQRELFTACHAKWRSITDVQKTWRMYGWQPPTEYRDDYLFKSNREIFEHTMEHVNERSH